VALRASIIMLLLGGIAALAIGLTAGLLQTPAATFGAFASAMPSPSVTLPMILIAGLADGINPCAFTLLLLFITTLLAGFGGVDKGAVTLARHRLFVNGGAFIGAIFLAYLVLGAGLLQVSTVLAQNHLGARLGALLAILLGLWMLKDYFLPDLGPRLSAPHSISRRVRAPGVTGSALAMFGLGALVSLCTVPCSGAVYIAVISLLALQEDFIVSYGYLLIYNIMFILPLVAILFAAASRPAFNQLARWNLRHRESMRLFLGAGVVLLGLAILATA